MAEPMQAPGRDEGGGWADGGQGRRRGGGQLHCEGREDSGHPGEAVGSPPGTSVLRPLCGVPRPCPGPEGVGRIDPIVFLR